MVWVVYKGAMGAKSHIGILLGKSRDWALQAILKRTNCNLASPFE